MVTKIYEGDWEAQFKTNLELREENAALKKRVAAFEKEHAEAVNALPPGWLASDTLPNAIDKLKKRVEELEELNDSLAKQKYEELIRAEKVEAALAVAGEMLDIAATRINKFEADLARLVRAVERHKRKTICEKCTLTVNKELYAILDSIIDQQDKEKK